MLRSRNLHRLLGFGLLTFVLLHLGNHAALFWGADQHVAVQKALRAIYRHPLVEPVLLAAFALQLGLGVRMLVQRRWPRRFWPRLQSISGGLLMLFLFQHIGAVLYTRATKSTIDTDIYWAASVVSDIPSALYFVPYYVFGLSAVFLHIAAFIALRKRRPALALWVCVLGVGFAVILVTTLTGAFFLIERP